MICCSRSEQQIPRCAQDDRGLLLLHELDLDRQLDVVAEDPAAGIERLVPVEAEVLPVDLAFRLEAHALTTPWAARAPLKFGVERDFARGALDREIADELQLGVDVALDALPLEPQRREFLDVPEIR